MMADYAAMLERLCRIADVAPAEQEQVVAQQSMLIDGLPTHFRYEEWSGFIKIYMEVGRPAPAKLPMLCQSILEQQLTLPAPFSMLAGLDAGSGSLILYGCAPLGEGSCEEDEGLLAFVQACADAAMLLRGVLE